MTWHRSPWVWRSAAAVLVAAGSVWLLQRQLALPATAAPKAVGWQPQVSPVERLGFPVVPIRGCVHLVAKGAPDPEGIAPVYEVLADGSLALRRSAAVATSPAAVPEHAVVRLPADSLVAMGPAARGAAAELLGALVRERPVPLARLRWVGMTPPADRVAAWLAWML